MSFIKPCRRFPFIRWWKASRSPHIERRPITHRTHMLYKSFENVHCALFGRSMHTKGINIGVGSLSLGDVNAQFRGMFVAVYVTLNTNMHYAIRSEPNSIRLWIGGETMHHESIHKSTRNVIACAVLCPKKRFVNNKCHILKLLYSFKSENTFKQIDYFSKTNSKRSSWLWALTTALSRGPAYK